MKEYVYEVDLHRLTMKRWKVLGPATAKFYAVQWPGSNKPSKPYRLAKSTSWTMVFASPRLAVDFLREKINARHDELELAMENAYDLCGINSPGDEADRQEALAVLDSLGTGAA